MNTLLAVSLLLSTLSPAAHLDAPPRYGLAKHYYPGLFQKVYETRVRQGLIKPGTPWGDGLASSTECRNIGKRALIRLWEPVRRTWGELQKPLIVDCSDPTKKRQWYGRFESDRDRHIREGLFVEVNYELARSGDWEWDGRRGGRTRVMYYGVE